MLFLLNSPHGNIHLSDQTFYESLKLKQLIPYLTERGIPKKNMTRAEMVSELASWDRAEIDHRRRSAACYQIGPVMKSATTE